MEETMRRIAIIAATLLVSAFGAQAAPQKVLHHPAHRWVAGNPAGIGGLSTASLPLGYKAIVDDSINALQRGSAHPRAHDSACMARQSKLADDIERLAGASAMVQRNPAMIELRTRCMPVHVCINCPTPY
jgi:hypothetical protein